MENTKIVYKFATINEAVEYLTAPFFADKYYENVWVETSGKPYPIAKLCFLFEKAFKPEKFADDFDFYKATVIRSYTWLIKRTPLSQNVIHVGKQQLIITERNHKQYGKWYPNPVE